MLHKLLIVMLLCGCGHAVAGDSLSLRRVKILPVPALGFAPETRAYLGAVCLFAFRLTPDTLARMSTAKAEVNFTQNKQVITEAQWVLFSEGERWLFRGNAGFLRYPDRYFGVGAGESPQPAARFGSDRIGLLSEVLRQVRPRLFAGGGIKYLRYGNVTAGDSVFARYPELKAAAVLGIKGIVNFDTRNSLLNATRGAFVNAEGGLCFSATSYAQFSLDVRAYHTWRKRITVAGRFYQSLVSGNPPFFDYSLMGGDKVARGYFYGVYRDHHLSTFQGESRVRIWGPLGVAVFAGATAVYNRQTLSGIAQWKPNAGAGLRVRVDKKENINLRVDVGFGADKQTGFYIAFGESF